MAILLDTQGLDIDFDAFELSEKILVIIFIVLLVGSNAISAFATVARHGLQAFTQSRHIIRLSMALAGCLLGLFTMVVFAVLIFEQDPDIFSCITTKLASIYDTDFITVIYACGLSLLAVDIIERSKTLRSEVAKPGNNSPLAGLFMAILPWLIGSAVVGPLSLTNMDWNGNCVSQQREGQVRARLVVCGVVPPCIALLVSMVCICLVSLHTKSSTTKTHNKRPKNSYTFDNPIFDNNNHNQDNSVAATTPPPTTTITTTTTATTTAVPEPVHKNNPYMVGTDETNGTQTPTPTSAVSLASSQPGNAHTASSPNPQAPHHNHTNGTSPTAIFVGQRKDNTPYDREATGREAKVLLACSMLLALIVIPHYALALYVMSDYRYTGPFVYRVDTGVFIASIVLVWVKTLFPVLVPLISMAV